MPSYNCKNCGKLFEARLADRKRGWAKFCSKSCKATKQESRTGQFSKLLQGRREYGEPTFSNAHQFDNTEK